MLPPELQGCWLCRSDAIRSLVEGPAPAAMYGNAYGRAGYNLVGNVAVVQIAGLMTKGGGYWFRGCSTIELRNQIRAAVEDPKVGKILLQIDSPGGQAAGTAELAAEVAAANKVKPVYAFIEDLGASAAYWVASQARKVFTNSTGIVGSIGTYAVVVDMSGMAAKLGIKVHVIKAGEFKGAGSPGTEITDAQLAEWQRTVNSLNEHFLAGVAQGRNLSAAAVRKLADGRAHVGKAAHALGLVDAVGTLESAYAALSAAPQTAGQSAGPTTRNRAMDDQETISQFEALLATAHAANPGDRLAAVKAAIKQAGPELHAAYIAASRALSDARRIERGGAVLRR